MSPAIEPRTAVTMGLLLIGVAISSLVLFRTRPAAPEEGRTPDLGVAYFLKDAELIGMGQEGKVLYRVTADSASQSLDDAGIGMKNVRVTYEPASGIPWDLAADTGRIPPDGNIIELRGRVLAVSRQGDVPATTIRTDYLEVEPAGRTAVTRSKVTVEFDGRKINATGLRADLQRNQLELLSNVSGKFEP